MANRRVTPLEDPLIQMIIRIPQSQKDFLDNLGESASGFIRKLIDAQMSGHKAEISKLEEENRRYEAHININKAQINELKAADQRKQTASMQRDELLEKIAQRLKNNLRRDYKGNWEVTPELQKFLKNNVFDANQRLNGSGDKIKETEVLDRIFQIREVEEAIA